MFTKEKVINWSHNAFKTRFSVSVGVAYGSNVDLVKQLLVDAATEHPQVNVQVSVSGQKVFNKLAKIYFEVLEGVFFYYISEVKSKSKKDANRIKQDYVRLTCSPRSYR